MPDPVGLSIERAQPGDEPAVMELFSRCIQHMLTQGIDQWDAIYPNLQNVQTDIRERTLFLARHAGQLCGVVTLNDQQSPEYLQAAWSFHDAPILVVHRVAIAPESQGRGIARHLMAYAEDHARKNGYCTIRLDSFTQNPRATRLYENLSYQKAGTVRFRKGTFCGVLKNVLPKLEITDNFCQFR